MITGVQIDASEYSYEIPLYKLLRRRGLGAFGLLAFEL